MAVIPASERSPEWRKENGRKGGIKSGETRRSKAEMRETLKAILAMPLNKKKCYEIDEIETFAQLNGKTVDVETAILIKQVLILEKD